MFGKYSFEPDYRNRKRGIEFNTQREPGASHSQPGKCSCTQKNLHIYTVITFLLASHMFFFLKELNDCLAAELSLMHSRMNGEVKHSQSSQEKDTYQLEVQLDTLHVAKCQIFTDMQ